MKTLCGLALALVAGGVIAYHVTAQPKPGVGDDREIRAAAAAFAAAFSKGDMAAVIGCWADDADYVDDAGTAYRGKPAIAELFTKNAEKLKGHTMAIAVGSVKFTRPDVALEEGVVTVTPPGGVGEASRYVAVWVRNEGKWLLSSVRDQPGAAAADDRPDALQGVAWLMGDWAHEKAGVRVTLSCKSALGGQFMTQEYVITRAGADATSVVQYLGWDPATQRLRSWVFDSDGGNGQAIWERNGNTWTAAAEGVLGDGRPGTATNAIRFVDDGTFVWMTTDRTVDGQPVADAEITFTRVGSAPAGEKK